MSISRPYDIISDALSEAQRLEVASHAKPVVPKVSATPDDGQSGKASAYDEIAPEGEIVSVVDLRQRMDAVPAAVWQALPDRTAKALQTVRGADELFWSDIIDVRFALQQALEWMKIQPERTLPILEDLTVDPTAHWYRNHCHIGGCMDLVDAEASPSTLSADVMTLEQDRGNLSSFIGERSGEIVSMSSWEMQYNVHWRYFITQVLAHPDAPDRLAGEQIDLVVSRLTALPDIAALVHGRRRWVQTVLEQKGFVPAAEVQEFFRDDAGRFADAVVMKLRR